MFPSPPAHFLSLADTALSAPREGPRRFCEDLPSGARRVVLGAPFLAPSDEAIEARFAWLKTIQQRRLFFRVVGLLNILRHFSEIRRADLIRCHAPHHFWWLLFLDRVGLLRLPRQRVLIIYFLSDSFLRRLRWWKEASFRFHAFFVSREQIADLEARGCPPGHQSYLAYRIDTDWYRPATQPRGGYLVAVGNIHRDEQLIIELAKNSPVPILRIGQIGRLRDVYRDTAVQLVFNATHAKYLDLVRNAAGLLLPIEPCDEPAGLTALLEALACEIPVLANASLEVGSLLERALGNQPLPDLQPATWRTAIDDVLAGRLNSPEDRRRARAFVVAEHSIPDVASEWQPLLGVFAAPSPPC